MLTKTNKGYNLIQWTVTLAIVVAAFSIVQMPLKRALQTKIRQTAGYVLWKNWGEDIELLAPTDQYSRTRSLSDQKQHTYVNEGHAGKVKYGAKNKQNEDMVSSAVEPGSEALLNTVDLNKL